MVKGIKGLQKWKVGVWKVGNDQWESISRVNSRVKEMVKEKS